LPVYGCRIFKGYGTRRAELACYAFINKNDYFAQKTLMLLTEQTVAILGYSLSDPNLKAILNELTNMSMRSLQRGNIYYITRASVPRFVRDRYEASFGITVVEETARTNGAAAQRHVNVQRSN